MILAIYIILFSTLNAQTQQLPKSDLVAKIDNKKEIFRITYNNDGYSFDGKHSFPSIEHLSDSICQILNNNRIEKFEIPMGYVSLHINKNAPISVFDSIRSELQSLYLLTVFHKAKGLNHAGIILRLAEPSDDKILKLSNNGYYPKISSLNDCNPPNSEDSEYEEEVIPITRPTQPLDILYRLANNQLQGVENEKDLHIVKIQDNKFNINGVNVKSKEVTPIIRDVIKNQNYCIVVDMGEINTYNDYFKCIEVVIEATNAERMEYVNIQLHENNDSKTLFYENQALRIFPLIIYSYLPSDKRYNEMKNNR